MSGDNIHNDPRLDEWTHMGGPVVSHAEPQLYDPYAKDTTQYERIESEWREPITQPLAPLHANLNDVAEYPNRGPELYQPPPAPELSGPAPNRSLIDDGEVKLPQDSKLSIVRRLLIIAFCFTGLIGIFAGLREVGVLEKGLIFLLATLIGTGALHGLSMRHIIVRGVLSIAIGATAAAAATAILPALGLWPSQTTGLLTAMTFATVGTLSHSRLCLGIALIVLVNLLFQDGGLGLMPGRTQIAVLALFGIGLLGGVTTGSRFIATVSLLALFIAHMHIMASSALPSGSALGVTLITALCAAGLLRSTLKRGLLAAFEPMVAAVMVFVAATVTLQLILLGGNGGPDMLETAPMRGSVVTVLLAAQALVFVSSLYDWFENRASLQSVLAAQALLAVLALMLIDPRRMNFIPGLEASAALALLFGAVMSVVLLRVLFYAWRADKPVITAASALVLMVEAIILLQFAVSGMDIAVTALVCASVAIILAILMAIFGRKPLDRATG